jgi:hypothetical protein
MGRRLHRALDRSRKASHHVLSTKARTYAITSSVVIITGAGVAFAGWTTGGSGSAPTAAVGAAPLSVEVGEVSGLYPGGSAMVDFVVTNGNVYAVTLDTAHPHSFTADTAHAGCLVDEEVVTGRDVALNEELAAGASSPRRQVRITLSASAVDACQGARFTFDLDVTAVSVGG